MHGAEESGIVWIVINDKLVYYDYQAATASTTNAAWFEV